VKQKGRFADDESVWSRGLSKPSIKRLGNDADLRFDLTSASDFEFFAQMVEKDGETLPWIRKHSANGPGALSLDLP
jgi:hypothetical protein